MGSHRLQEAVATGMHIGAGREFASPADATLRCFNPRSCSRLAGVPRRLFAASGALVGRFDTTPAFQKAKSPASPPGPCSDPYGQSGRFTAAEGEEPALPGVLPAEPAAPPLAPLVEPLIDPLAAPVVLPAGAPGLAAVFNRAWPVALSLQCVAAEMLSAEGDGVAGDGLDCAAAPTMLAPRNAAEIRRVLYMGVSLDTPPWQSQYGRPGISQ
jgi:hypothetical protein